MDLLEERSMRELDKDFQDYLDNHYDNRRKFNLKTIPCRFIPCGGVFISEEECEVLNDEWSMFLLLVKKEQRADIVDCDVLGTWGAPNGLGNVDRWCIEDSRPVAYTGMIMRGEKR